MHDFSLLEFLQGLPVVIQVGCVGLFVATMMFAATMWRSSSRLIHHLMGFEALFDGFMADSQTKSHGMSLEQLDALRVQTESLTGLHASWWHQVSPNIEAYTPVLEEERFFLVEAPREILSYEWIVGRNFNASLYSVLPGILTGVGLMLTFLAILIALVSVHYDKANTVEPITGIDALINGLSGKFTSSILALSQHSVYLF